jgi:streptogrisin C
MGRRMLAIAAAVITAATLTPQPSQAAPPKFDIAPGMLAAMRRDLKLDDGQIAVRLRTEAAAPVVEKRLRAQLGTTFAGAWIPEGATRLTVAVTDAKSEAAVRAEGANPALVSSSAADLSAQRTKLDRYSSHAAGAGVRGWYVDVPANRVVVLAAPGKEAAARQFAKAGGVTAVTVRTQAEQPRTMYDIRGGDQYVINGNTLCSVGFAVAGGFVSAGHCGGTGSPTLGYNNVSQGTFAGSSFPGNDYSWIRTNGNWTSQPWVNNYSGGNVVVAGSNDAAIGSSICRSGRTTG